MEVLVPKRITYDKLVSSNISTSSLSEWLSSSTYSDTNEVKVSFEEDGVTRRTPITKFESLANSNIGNYPPYSPTKWSEIGVTNRWAMFDNSNATQTIADGTESTSPGEIVVRVDTSKVSNIILLNLDATDIEVTTYDSLGQQIGDTQISDLEITQSVSWSDYFFREFTFSNELFVTIPLRHVSQTVVKIKNSGVGVFPKCGVMSIGNMQDIGYTQYGVSTGILNFSKIVRDDFGNASINEGNYVNTIDLDVVVDTGRFDAVVDVLTSVRGVGTVFQANNSDTNFRHLNVFGFLRDWNMVMSSWSESEISLEIEGLL